MRKMPAKNKIVLIVALWLALSASMFFYFFNLLEVNNQKTLDSMAQQRTELALLQAEKQSYLQARQDLEALKKEPYQPDEFFSRDITLVNEIRTFEALGQKLGVQMQLSGVSGTAATAQKAKTITALAVIPYGISLTGTFDQAVKFLDAMENLSFVTNVGNVSVNAVSGGQVAMSLSANFYIKK